MLKLFCFNPIQHLLLLIILDATYKPAKSMTRRQQDWIKWVWILNMSTHETWLLNESGLDWQNFQNIHISNQQDIIHYNRISLEPLQLGFLLLKVLKLFNSLINYYGYHSTKLLLILLARFYKFNIIFHCAM